MKAPPTRTWTRALATVALALVILPAGAVPAADGKRSSAGTAGGPSEAYYQFLLGKLRRMDGELGDAADHLNLAAGADDSSAIRVELAETYLRMGEVQKAIEQATLATRRNPDDAEARRTLAEAYSVEAATGPDKDNSTSKAIAEYQALVRLVPGDIDARMSLGRLFLQEDRAAEALEQFRAIKASGVDPVTSGLMVARALLRVHRIEEAAAELRDVLTLSPSNYDALLGMAQISESRADWTAASDFYLRLSAIRPTDNSLRAKAGFALIQAERGAEAIGVLRESVRRDPTDHYSRDLLARALNGTGSPGEALKELAVLQQYRPDDPAVWVEVGRIRESRSETDMALECYQRALSASEAGGANALSPDAEMGLILSIASLQIQGDDPAAALRTLDRVPADGSEAANEAGILAARALIASGRAGDAMTRMREIAEKNPKSIPAALVLLEARLAAGPRTGAQDALAAFDPDTRSPREVAAAAEVLRKAGQEKLATALFEKSLQQHPQDSYAQFAAGAFLQTIGRNADGEKLLRRAIELDPKNALALNFLGYNLAEKGGDLAQAEALTRRALEVEPDNGAYVDTLGWVLFKRGNLQEARGALEHAADLVAGDATVREHLGDVYEKMGDTPRALAEWKTAQTLRPKDPKPLRRKIMAASKDGGGR